MKKLFRRDPDYVVIKISIPHRFDEHAVFENAGKQAEINKDGSTTFLISSRSDYSTNSFTNSNQMIRHDS